MKMYSSIVLTIQGISHLRYPLLLLLGMLASSACAQEPKETPQPPAKSAVADATASEEGASETPATETAIEETPSASYDD